MILMSFVIDAISFFSCASPHNNDENTPNRRNFTNGFFVFSPNLAFFQITTNTMTLQHYWGMKK